MIAWARRHSFAITSLVLGYTLVILCEVCRRGSLDQMVARWANTLIGRSPTYDLTLAFLIMEPGDFLGPLVMTIGLAALCRTRFSLRANKGTYLALALLVLINVGLTYEIVDNVHERIRFLSPASVLKPFTNVAKLYGIDFDLTRDRTYPSQRTALYMLVMLLGVLRFGPAGLILLPPALFFSLPRMLVGAEGMTGFIGGFLLATWMTFFNACLFRYYRLAERWLEETHGRLITRTVAGWLARLLSRTTRAEKVNPFGRREGAALKPVKLDAELAAFVARTWGFSGIRMELPPSKGKLYQLLTDQGKFAFKVTRYGEKQAELLQRVLEFTQRLAAQGAMLTPPILPTRGGHLLTRYHERLVYVMGWMEGRPLDIGAPDEVAQLMTTLAAFHIHGEGEIDPGEWTAAALIQRAIDQMAEEATGLVASSSSYERESEEEALSALREELTRARIVAQLAYLYAQEDQTAPRVCYPHGDAHPLNFMRQSDGRLAVLDFDRVRPDLGYVDLIPPLVKLMHRYQWSAQVFQETLQPYLERRPLPRFELVLLIAGVLYPWRTLRLLRKGVGRKRGGLRVRLLRESLVSRVQFAHKRRFIGELASLYRLPLITLAFAGPLEGVLPPEALESTPAPSGPTEPSPQEPPAEPATETTAAGETDSR